MNGPSLVRAMEFPSGQTVRSTTMMLIRAAGSSARSSDSECASDHENYQSTVDWSDDNRACCHALYVRGQA
jgi:hypothetical protein